MTRFEGFGETQLISPVWVRTVSLINPCGNGAFGGR